MSITVEGVRGMQSAADHANRDVPGWTELAYETFLAAAAVDPPGTTFTIEQIRERCTALPAPPDGRAWGAVVVRAAKRGKIEKTGDFLSAKSSHGSPKPLWRYVWRR